MRIATKPPFRRDAANLPGLAFAIAAFGIGAAVLGIWMVIRWPAIRHVAAVGVATAMIFAWWRARPSYGLRRGWPPGSLGIGRSLDAINDRTFYRDQARTHGPVFKMSQFGRPVVCVLGLGRARQILNEHASAIVAATLPYNRRFPKGTLRYMASSDHREEAPVFRKTFGALELDAGEETIRAACREMLSTLTRDSASKHGGARGREYFARWLMVALSRIFFGLSPNDPRIAELTRVLSKMWLGVARGSRGQRQFEEALVTATEIMRGVARDGATSFEGAANGTALRALLEADPGALDDAGRARNFFLVFRVAHGDLTGLMDWLFRMLSDNAEWQSKVRAAGRTSGSPSGSQPMDIATRVVLETLRLEQSEYMYRKVARPITIGEYTVPSGWLLRVCVQDSHRDPNTFPDPDTFNPDRFLARTFSRSEYSPFGVDVHGCMGARVTFFLGRILVEELCIGYEWQVTRIGPLERGGSRHRDHWRPSTKSRVVMRSATDGCIAAAAPAS